MVEAQDPRSQKSKAGPAIHLPLEKFKPMHLPFDLPVAPGLADASQDSSMIPLDSRRKTLPCRNVGCLTGL
jgi:hypothetical protein